MQSDTYEEIKRGLVPTLLFTTLSLAFIMAHRPVVWGRVETSAGFLFLGLYFALFQALVGHDASYGRRLMLVNVGLGGLLWLVAGGIAHLPSASSSLAMDTLWERPLSGWHWWLGGLVVASASDSSFHPLCPSTYPPFRWYPRAYWMDGVVWLLFVCSIVWMSSLEMPDGMVVWGKWVDVGLVFYGGLLLKLFIGYAFPLKWSGTGQGKWWVRSSGGVDVFFLLLFVGTCLVTNLLVVHHIQWWGCTFTAGVLTYPLTFLCLDIVTERYGSGKARGMIWLGLVSNGLLLMGIVLTGWLPSGYDSSAMDVLFWSSFGFVSTSLVASVVAYLSAQFLGLTLFCLLRRATGGRYLWLRNNLSTMVSQGVDTVLFALIAWGLWYMMPASEEMPLDVATWVEIARNEYGVKVLLALLDTPILYGVLGLLRGWGSEAERCDDDGRQGDRVENGVVDYLQDDEEDGRD